MRKPTFCICESKDADQLRGSQKAEQCLCFRYIDSTIPLLPKSEISSLKPSSVAVQPGLSGFKFNFFDNLLKLASDTVFNLLNLTVDVPFLNHIQFYAVLKPFQ